MNNYLEDTLYLHGLLLAPTFDFQPTTLTLKIAYDPEMNFKILYAWAYLAKHVSKSFKAKNVFKVGIKLCRFILDGRSSISLCSD